MFPIFKKIISKLKIQQRVFLFFSGSGGAIVGLLPDPSRFEELRKAYEGEGFVVTRVRPNIPGGEDSKNTVDEEEVAMTTKANSSSSNTSDVEGSDSSSSKPTAVKEASSSSNSSPVKGSNSNSSNSNSNGTIPEGELSADAN